MSDYIQLAATLVRAAPTNAGDPLPTWDELEELGDLMRNAAVMIRHQGEERSKLLATLIDVRTWIGDGEMSDGLHRAHWTPEYAAIVDRVDAAISKAKGQTP